MSQTTSLECGRRGRQAAEDGEVGPGAIWAHSQGIDGLWEMGCKR